MTIFELLLFAPAILTGWLAVRLFITPRANAWTPVLDMALGVAVGLGVDSIVYFLLLWANITGRVALLVIELAVLACAVWMFARRHHRLEAKPTRLPKSPWFWVLRAAAAVALVFFILNAAKSVAANPHGGWDAFSIWNVKAKFLAGGSATWQRAMSPVAGGTLTGANHPGYPLMLPTAVAGAWTIQGNTSNSTPAVLGLVFAFATVALVFGALVCLRGEMVGWIGLLLLLASDGFASQLGAQSADIPIALYFLSTLALIALASTSQWPAGTLVVAGFCAGLAVWTKNEGIPFFIVVAAVVLWTGGKRSAGWLALGASPALAVWAAFKLLLVHAAEGLFSTGWHEVVTKVMDPARWLQIMESFLRSTWSMGIPWAHPILIAALLAVTLGLVSRSRRHQLIWLLVPVAGLLAADFAAYLVTTADLSWHLGTSNLRLLVQVWPALVLLTGMLIEAPALMVAPAAQVQTPARGKSYRKPGKKAKAMPAK